MYFYVSRIIVIFLLSSSYTSIKIVTRRGSNFQSIKFVAALQNEEILGLVTKFMNLKPNVKYLDGVGRLKNLNNRVKLNESPQKQGGLLTLKEISALIFITLYRKI